MYLNQLIWILFVCASVSVSAQCNGLIISKYIEGSSYNKGLELTNASKNAVQLSDYHLLFFNNGSSTVSQEFAFPDSLLESKASVTITRSAATIFSEANYEFGFSFTGDDAIALINITANDTVDVLGVIGEQPNQGWEVNALEKATSDHTLVRNSDVTKGIKNWAESQNTWTVYPKDSLGGFGSHQLINPLPDCSITTGISSKETDSFSVNPTFITPYDVLHFQGVTTPFKLQIIDVKGKVIVLENEVKSIEYQVRNTLPSGIYFLRVLDANNSVRTQKLMVE